MATEYVDEHRKELRKKYRNETQFVEQFAVTESILQHLIDLGTKDGVVFNQEQYDTSRPIIELIIKGIIGRDIFEQSTYFRVVNPISPNYREAVRIISSPQAYLSYLSVRSNEFRMSYSRSSRKRHPLWKCFAQTVL